jgi:Ca2+:H+ antiporter
VDPLLKELRHNPMLWLLALVPVALVAAQMVPDAHTLLFVLSVLAIVPLATLLSHATESVAEKTGDAAGGLFNATLGNLTELVIAAAALRAGEYALVKGSIAGAIVTNTLFMLGASFLLGGLKYHVQEYNRATARLHAALLFLATIALVSPSAIAKADLVPGAALSYVIGPTPMDLQFWPGAVVMVFIATLLAAFITSGGRSAWFIGALLLFVYAIFAITLYMLPPQVP